MNAVLRKMRVQRPPLSCYYVAVLLVALPFCTVVFLVNGPANVTEDVTLQQQIAELHERLRHAEMLNQERHRDIVSLRQSFGVILQTGPLRVRPPISRNHNGSVYVGRGTLWQQNQQQYHLPVGTAHGLDLELPSLHHYLPHLLNYLDGLQPALKLAGSRTGVSMVMGIPTVKRPVQSYLVPTLQNLIDSMDELEKEDSLLIVCIAETDRAYVEKQTEEIKALFQQHIDSGLLEVIAPPASYYPDFRTLRHTLGDPMDRVRWRTKQNLDYAYLMMYAQAKGTFYVQLEDDILTKPHYVTTMKNFAYRQLRENKEWIILDFCQLGFIGKMFKTVELSKLVTFFAIFHNDKPVDWLLDHMIQTKVCRFDRDTKECKKQKDGVWIHYRPSLFQHVGTHSSLKGKVQKLKDKQFGKMSVHYPHKNPTAVVRTTLKAYRSHTLHRAYRGEAYFWSLMPQRGDNITFYFSPPVLIERYYFRTGNADHPEDVLVNATVHVLPAVVPKIPDLIPYPSTADGYLVVGGFTDYTGVAEGSVVPTVGPVRIMRVNVDQDSDHWLVISEMVIQTAPIEVPIASAYNMTASSENSVDAT